MERRDALKMIISTFGVGAFATPASAEVGDAIKYFGALPPSSTQKRLAAKRPRRRFYDRFGVFKGASKEKDTFLWKNLEVELKKPLVPHYQGTTKEGVEGEGDCVAQAGSLGCDILAATDIHMLGQRERFVAKASVEMNYAGSRVEIGKGVISRGGGSHGEWMARFLKEYGVIHRLEYRDGDNHIDLRGYDPARSRKYRNVGVPDWLEPIAKQHPVQEYTNVQTAQEALDAVTAGQPVLICSTYAIHNTRDAEGFALPFLAKQWNYEYNERGRLFRRWGRKQWWHCMLLCGSLTGARPGGVIMNSHGVWNSGPQPHGIPDGGFAIDLKYLDLMVKDWGTCYALSSYKGHKSTKIRRKIKLF